MPTSTDDENPVIAVDLGATMTRVSLIGDDGMILGKASSSTPISGESPGVIPRHLSGLIRQVLSEAGMSSPGGIGISACGPVDHRKGAIVRPPNLPFREIPLVEPLRAEFGVPVRLANDCHAGVLGEAVFGAGAGCRDIVYITISTGIGGGVVAGGRLVLGRDGNAAEIGHFHVDSTWNLPCGCGCTGHWEGYASGRFLPQFFARWCEITGNAPGDAMGLTAEGIFSAARLGDPAADLFLEALGAVNGRGISDVIVAYDPSIIILDGSVVLRNVDLVLPRLLPHIDQFLPLPEIRLTALDGLAPLLGASVLARSYETVIGSLLPG